MSPNRAGIAPAPGDHHMSDDSQSFDADVIVVGAGPVGLTTGCALRHHGVQCLILEERTEVRP